MAGKKLEYLLSIVPELDKKKYAELKKKIEEYEGGNLVTFTPDEARKLKGLLGRVMDDVGEKASGLGEKIAQGVRDGLSKADLESALGVDIRKLKETVDVANKLSDILTKLSGSDSWMKSSEGFVKSLTDAKQQIEGFQTALKPISESFVEVGQAIVQMHENISRITKDIKDLQDTLLKTQGAGQNISPTFANTEIQEYIDELQELEKTLQQISSNSYEFKFAKDKAGQKRKLEKIVQEYKRAKEELENLDPDGEMSARDFAMESARQYDIIITSLKQIQILKQEIEKSSKGSVFKESVKIDFDVDTALKGMISKAKLSYAETLKILQEELNSDSGNKISSNTNIAIGLTIPTEKEIVNKINKTIAKINKKGSINSININLDDAANFIEDQSKRGYKNKNGEKPASDDANTDKLVEKTESRLDRITEVFDKKLNGKVNENGERIADGILQKTQKWREEMIKAMTISAKDLEFEFGWQNSVTVGAQHLEDELQHYFDQNPIDIRINTENLAKQVAGVIEENGITIGGSGGTASIDPKVLASAVAAGVNAAFFGDGVIDTSLLSESAKSFEQETKKVATETEQASEISSDYVKVLSESSLGVSTLVKSLRELAKLVNKQNPSKAANAMSRLLLGDGEGIDLGKITDNSSPEEIAQLLQEALFKKDDTGIARGSDLADTIRASLPKMPKGKATDIGKIVANNIEHLFNMQDIGVEFESEKNIRLNNVEAFKELLPTLQLLDYLGTVRSRKNKTILPSVQTIDEAITFFENQGRSTEELKKLRKASEKFEVDPTEENKKEFEDAANTFFKNTTLLFSELNEKSLGFKGKVYLKDGKGTRVYDKKGAYPRGIRYISEDDIQDVEFYEVAKGIDVGYTGSTQRNPKPNKRRAANMAARITLTDRPTYITSRETPDTDVRYQDIEYKSAQTYEKVPDKNQLAKLPTLKSSAETIPELEDKLNALEAKISNLEDINESLNIDINAMEVKGKKSVNLSNIKSIVDTVNSLNSGLRLLDNPIDSRTIENLLKLNIPGIENILNEMSSKVNKINGLDTKISTIQSAGSVDKLIQSSKKKLQGAEILKLVQSFQNVDLKKNIPSIANIDSLISNLPVIGEDNTVFKDIFDQIAQVLNPNKFKELEAKRKDLSKFESGSPEWVTAKNDIKNITDYIFKGFLVLVNKRNELKDALSKLDKNSPEYNSTNAELRDVNTKLTPILNQLAPIFSDKKSSINSIIERLTSLYGNVDISEMRSLISAYSDADLEKLIAQKNQEEASLNSTISQLKGILSRTLGNKNSDKAKEIELLVSQIKKAREALYAEADEYIKILDNKNLDEKTRKYTTGKLQQVLENIYDINTSASNLQGYTNENLLAGNGIINNVDEWAKKNYDLDYLNNLLETIKKLRAEKNKGTRPASEIDAEIEQFQKKVNAFRGQNIMGASQSQMSSNERELADAQKEKEKLNNQLEYARRNKREADAIESELAFTSEYIKLLEREKKLLEDIARLKKSGKTDDDKEVKDTRKDLYGVQGRIKDLLASTNTPEREEYARKQALAYQNTLRTVRMQKSRFTRDIAQVNSDEQEFEKYGLTAGAGFKEFNDYKKMLKRDFRQSEWYKSTRKSKIDSILRKTDYADSKFGAMLAQPIRDELIAARERVSKEEDANIYKMMQSSDFKKASDEKQNELLFKAEFAKVHNIRAAQREIVKKYIATKNGEEKSQLEEQYQKVEESFEQYKKGLWDKFDQEMKDIGTQFIESLKVEDGKLIGKSFVQNDDGTWSEVVSVIDENIEKTIKDRLRLAERRAIAEAGLAPLQAKENDLVEQKRITMRYGGLTEYDLMNDRPLSKIENQQQRLTALNNEITELLAEKKEIENSKLDEESKKKELAKLNKKIKAKTEEAENLEAIIEDSKIKIEQDNAAREERKSDEAKLARTQRKLERDKRNLEKAEASVNKWQKAMEETTDVSSRNQAELNYENAVKRRNGLKESIRKREERISSYEDRISERETGGSPTKSGVIEILTNSVVEGIKEALSGIGGIYGDGLATESTLRIIADALTGGNLYQEWINRPRETPRTTAKKPNNERREKSTSKDYIDPEDLTGVAKKIYDNGKKYAESLKSDSVKTLSDKIKALALEIANGTKGGEDYIQKQYNLNKALSVYERKLKSAGKPTSGRTALGKELGIPNLMELYLNYNEMVNTVNGSSSSKPKAPTPVVAQETPKKEKAKLTGKALEIDQRAQENAKKIALEGKDLPEQLKNAKAVLKNMVDNLGQAGTDEYVEAQYNLNVALRTYYKLLKDAGYNGKFLKWTSEAGIKSTDYIGYDKFAAYQFGSQGGLARESGESTQKNILAQDSLKDYHIIDIVVERALSNVYGKQNVIDYSSNKEFGEAYYQMRLALDRDITQEIYDDPNLLQEFIKPYARQYLSEFLSTETIPSFQSPDNRVSEVGQKEKAEKEIAEILSYVQLLKDALKGLDGRSSGKVQAAFFAGLSNEVKEAGFLLGTEYRDVLSNGDLKILAKYDKARENWAKYEPEMVGNTDTSDIRTKLYNQFADWLARIAKEVFGITDLPIEKFQDIINDIWIPAAMEKGVTDISKISLNERFGRFTIANRLGLRLDDDGNEIKANTEGQLKSEQNLSAEKEKQASSMKKQEESIMTIGKAINMIDKAIGKPRKIKGKFYGGSDAKTPIGMARAYENKIHNNPEIVEAARFLYNTKDEDLTSNRGKITKKRLIDFHNAWLSRQPKNREEVPVEPIVEQGSTAKAIEKDTQQNPPQPIIKKFELEDGTIIEGTEEEIKEYLATLKEPVNIDVITDEETVSDSIEEEIKNNPPELVIKKVTLDDGTIIEGTEEELKEYMDSIQSGNNSSSSNNDDNTSSSLPNDTIPRSGNAPMGGILGALDKLARENTLKNVNSNIENINTSLGTANTTLNNVLAKLTEIAKHNAMSGQRNSALDLLTRLQNTLKFSYDTNKEYLGYMNLENGILTDFFSGDEGTISKEMLASLREAYGNIALDAQIHTHGQTNNPEDAFFSSKELTGQFAQDFADGIKKQILLSNEGITVLDLSDVDPTKVETTLKAISDAGPSMEKILIATKDTGARYLSQKFDNLTLQAFVKMLGIKGIESKLTQAQTEEMATRAIAENDAKEAAKIIQDSTGKAVLTTAERFGAEMRTITEKTDTKGNKTWSVTTSNNYTKAAQAANRDFSAKKLENVFGKNTKAYKALNEYKTLYESLFGADGLVTKFNISKDNQTPELQSQIDALIPKLEKAENKLKSLIIQQEKFANRDNIVATLSQGKMRNKRNNLEKIAKEQLLNTGIENFATAGIVGTNNGQSLMVDTLKNGYITRYAFELDEATGQVRMMEQAQTALANAFQNVNKVMKQNEIVRANITMTDDVKSQEAYLAQLKSPIWDEYSNKLKELQKLVSHVWSKKTGPSKEDEARIMALSERIIALGRDIQKTSNDFKNMMAYIPDEDIISINRGKNAGSTKEQLENWAKERARASQSQYEFVGFDNEQLIYKMIALDGAITKCTIAYSDMYNMAGIVEEKQTNSVDKTVAKIQQYEEAIRTAKEMRYLDGNDKDAQKFADILVKIQSIINNSNLSLEEQQKQIEALRQEALRYGEATKKTIGQNIKSFSGINEINAAKRQFNKFQGIYGFERGENPEILNNYITAYDALIEKFEKYSDAKMVDSNVQEELRREAAYVQSLGREYNKSATEASKLKEYVEQSGESNFTKNGNNVILGGQTEFMGGNLRSQMEEYAKSLGHINMENVKYNATKKEMTFVTRINNEQVADMVVRYNNATNSLYLYNKQQRESLSGLKLIGAEFKKKIHQILQYTASITSIYRVWSMLRQGVVYVKEIDSALTELKKVTDETNETYNKFLKTASKTANLVGSTIKDIVSSTADWARLGYSLEQASKLAEVTSILLNVSEFQSIDDATSALVSTMQAFGYAAEDSMSVIDVMNEIGELLPVDNYIG